jgi:hypothetical protein
MRTKSALKLFVFEKRKLKRAEARAPIAIQSRWRLSKSGTLVKSLDGIAPNQVIFVPAGSLRALAWLMLKKEAV